MDFSSGISCSSPTMKISFHWLKQYIEITEQPEAIAELLTKSGLEVAGITRVGPTRKNLDELVIGQIITCKKHPNADQLSITQVAIGQEAPLQIICGAPNVRAGQKVVVAPIGTQLHPQEGKAIKIKKAKIRGEV